MYPRKNKSQAQNDSKLEETEDEDKAAPKSNKKKIDKNRKIYKQPFNLSIVESEDQVRVVTSEEFTLFQK